MQAMETVGPIGPIEVPTPAHAVRLRRPVCLTATYVVACTALLVSVSLLPFGSGATAPVANARGDRERAGPVVERARRASEDPSFDSNHVWRAKPERCLTRRGDRTTKIRRSRTRLMAFDRRLMIHHLRLRRTRTTVTLRACSTCTDT